MLEREERPLQSLNSYNNSMKLKINFRKKRFWLGMNKILVWSSFHQVHSQVLEKMTKGLNKELTKYVMEYARYG